MGTTLTQIQTGNISYKWVVAIEGYPYLLTNATSSQATTAWSGTDWSQALSGLTVNMALDQQLDPWNPIVPNKDVSFCVLPDPTATQPDQFGIDQAATALLPETRITSTLDRSSTTLNVASTTGFTSTGTGYIGTECFSYSGVTSTSFTGVTRGKFSPFAAGGSGSPRFAQYHRVGSSSDAIPLNPIVTQGPRNWEGRLVGIWMHRNVGGILDTKAQAQLVFAGTIASRQEQGDPCMITVTNGSIINQIKDAQVGRDLWVGQAADGMYIPAGWSFAFSEKASSTTISNANPLTVVVSGASGTNQINQGWYLLADIYGFLHTWLFDEASASRLFGLYTFRAVKSGTGYITRVAWQLGSSGQTVQFVINGPKAVMEFLGFAKLDADFDQILTQPQVNVSWSKSGAGGTGTIISESPYSPLRAALIRAVPNSINMLNMQIQIASSTGTYYDQSLSLPPAAAQFVSGSSSLYPTAGLFVIDGSTLCVGCLVGATLTALWPITESITGHAGSTSVPFEESFVVPYTPDGAPIEIKQVVILTGAFGTILKWLLCSTGTANYNNATYDVLPYGIGVAIPGELLTGLLAQIDNIPGINYPVMMRISQPTKLADLLAADLTARLSFIFWKLGSVQVDIWTSPNSDQAIATLDETNKAEPVGNSISNRSVTLVSGQNVKNLVKIYYNKDITDISSDGTYTRNLTLADNDSIDSSGNQAAAFTLNMANSYAYSAGNGAGVESLIPNFLASLPLFSRPMSIIRRSVSLQYYEGYGVGDIVNITDKFARDPNTGKHGISTRPGLIIRHSYTLGGPDPANGNKPTPPIGEVDIMVMATNRTATYAPSCDVDSTATTGLFVNGYDPTNHILRCLNHSYSDASEVADPSRFAANDHVLIVERDPVTLASPVNWQRQISGVSGTDITLTSALTSPSFDTSKKYRIIADHYSADQTSQQAKAFQADASTLLIEASAAPFMYANVYAPTTFVAEDHTTPASLPAPLSYTANGGKPRDTGYDFDCIRTLENVMDHKTGRQNPWLVQASDKMVNTTFSTGNKRRLGAIRRVYVCPISQSTLSRNLYISPFFRSADGTSTEIRVTVSQNPPDNNGGLNDILLPSPAVSQSWTTSSTTWQTGAELPFPTKFQEGGLLYILIEIGFKGECIGLAQCVERERF